MSIRLRNTIARSLWLGALGASLLCTHLPAARAEATDQEGRAEPLPDELEGIGITEHLNATLPLDLAFTDDEGRAVRLGDYFRGQRPVILNLVYYQCPMLCTLVLNGVTEGMRGLAWTLGQEYENVTVSINPAETAELARVKKENYLAEYGKPGTAAGWHFLTGRQEEITALAQAVGFGYRFDPETNQFIHTAATFVCTPDGRISRYLYGIEYEEQTFRLALLEASQGRIGTQLDRLVLYCFQYDAEAGRYAPVAINIMRIGGAISAVALLGLLGWLWGRERRLRRLRAAQAEGRS
jgi:protein SCO1/2